MLPNIPASHFPILCNQGVAGSNPATGTNKFKGGGVDSGIPLRGLYRLLRAANPLLVRRHFLTLRGQIGGQNFGLHLRVRSVPLGTINCRLGVDQLRPKAVNVRLQAPPRRILGGLVDAGQRFVEDLTQRLCRQVNDVR